MGTRSVIGVMHGDVCKAVYCHWDGYLSHNGRILHEHYDSAKANHLVALGDISSLEKNIGEKHPFSPFHLPNELRNMTEGQFEDAYGEMTTFYDRDRDQEGCEFKSLMNFESLLDFFYSVGGEFCYIMKDGVWFMFDSDNLTLRELATELQKV
jgi:hypothetical protein